MSLASQLSEISLPDTDGKTISLGELWAKNPAAIVFLRHYG
jgi:hypothetical protein